MTHHKHHSPGKAFIHDIAKITKPIGHSIAKITKPLGHAIEKGIHSAENVMTAPIHELGLTTRSLGGSLSIPLIVGGVAVLFFVMNRR
jgi:hypothetical protein